MVLCNPIPFLVRFLERSMSRIGLGLMLVICSFHFAAAQLVAGLNRDSLHRILNQVPADTNKVLTLLRLAESYENSRPDSASYYYELLRELSAKIGYPAGFVKYATNYSALLSTQGKFQQSLALLQQAADTCRLHRLDKQLIAVWGSFGVTYQYMEDYENAARYYLRILPQLEKRDEKHQLGAVYGNLTGLYYHLRQYDKAYYYGRRVLTYEERYKDPYAIAAACINLGMALKQLDSIPQARAFQQRAYRIALQLNNTSLQEAALINLGNTYNKSTEPDSYLPLYQKTLVLAQSMSDIVAKSESLMGISEALFWKKQYQQAELTLDTAISFALRHQQRDAASNMLLLMSDIQIALGRAQRSVTYRQQYETLQDSMNNEERTKNIQELEMKYEVGKKQLEILEKSLLLAQKDKAASRQKQWLIGTSAGVMLLILLLFIGFRTYKQKQELHIKNLQALRAAQETLQLKAKLEGEQLERKRISQEMHDDMGSGLTLLLFLSRSLAHQNDITHKINQTADFLLKKMNEIIWAMNSEENTLESLISYIHVHMAELLDNVGISYHFHIDRPIVSTAISQELRRNVYLVVKEAIHNVVKHARASCVSINVHVGKDLEISISDDGKGFDQEKAQRFGNGLKNMHARMAKINGWLRIEVSKGTCLALSVPLSI